MDALLDTVLSRLAYASLQAILLAALVYAACRFMPALSAAARSALWWLLGAQLVIGLACPTPVALPLLPAPAAPVPVATTGFAVAAAGTPDIDVATAPTVSWTSVLLAAWIAAVLVQFGIAAIRGYRLAGVVRRAMPHDDVRVDTLCARRARELGLRRSPRLAVSAEVDSPQVIGLWRPTILLPLDDRLDDEELDMALMHELAHVRRGDLLLGWIPVLARTLFFFHPIVHVAMREYALCREAACDALVVSRGRQAPRTYGRLLLRLGVAPHPHHALPGASPTFRTLKRRIDMLGQATDAPPRLLTFGLVAIVALIGVTPWRVVAADGTQEQPAVAARPSLAAAPAPKATAAAKAAPTVVAASPSPTSRPSPVPMPPTPRLSPTPLPPMPPMPPTPAAPAAPMAPAPPAAPPVPELAGFGEHPYDQTFIFFSDAITRVVNGSDDDIRRARAQREGAGDYAWYRDGSRAWVLKDPAYVKRIREAYDRARVPADDARDGAEKQAAIDERQAVLNAQMAKLSMRQAELVSRQADPSGSRDPVAYAAGHAAIGKEQADIAKDIAELDKQRAAIGQKRAIAARRQAEAAQKANAEVQAIVAEAIRNHAVETSH
ncbi:M56 family metallopeptidase [Luteibacter yeojuensis]|uniref:M56 family metallopeptidase n=1 Tax=Luteibacter yeojuensis TaxID=345309 RepID=A0A7X5QWY5_9GAMM|nr:M56 family metallopeptidase [Luteibacter yeojuensis]NID16948.1 M56 family metallopeptidase [Luteibacter yeojuensis]